MFRKRRACPGKDKSDVAKETQKQSENGVFTWLMKSPGYSSSSIANFSRGCTWFSWFAEDENSWSHFLFTARSVIGILVLTEGLSLFHATHHAHCMVPRFVVRRSRVSQAFGYLIFWRALRGPKEEFNPRVPSIKRSHSTNLEADSLLHVWPVSTVAGVACTMNESPSGDKIILRGTVALVIDDTRFCLSWKWS